MSASDVISRILAIVAMVIATGSLVVAVLTYRRSAARLRAWVGIRMIHARFEPVPEYWLAAVVRNRGHGSTQISDVTWYFEGDPEPRRFRLDGPHLPARIEGNQTLHWGIPLVILFRATRENSIAETRIRAVVETGSGLSLTTNWYVWPPREPDGDPSPETLDRLRAAAFYEDDPGPD
jgi:hypothetical protein